jgi:parvulin-like peptidyl-prolyl isomerase
MKRMMSVVAIASALWASARPADARQALANVKADIVVARVNGEPISGAEFRRMVGNPLTRQRLEQEFGERTAGPDELERLALRRLIQRRLMLQEAARRNLTVTDKELDTGIAGLRRRFDDLKSFGQWMRDQELDDRSLLATIGEEMLTARVAGALVADVRCTEAEIDEYYRAHTDDLRIDEIWIQVIVVSDRSTAEAIQRGLKTGEDFGRLAQRLSLGRRAKEGGDVGWVNAATLWPPMRDLVSTLKPGEAIGPLERGEEFLIVRLHQRRQGRAKTIEEARRDITSLLLAQKQHATLQAWMAEQEKRATIEVEKQLSQKE